MKLLFYPNPEHKSQFQKLFYPSPEFYLLIPAKNKFHPFIRKERHHPNISRKWHFSIVTHVMSFSILPPQRSLFIIRCLFFHIPNGGRKTTFAVTPPLVFIVYSQVISIYVQDIMDLFNMRINPEIIDFFLLTIRVPHQGFDLHIILATVSEASSLLGNAYFL